MVLSLAHLVLDVYNGKRLLDFCASNQLLVSNTWFQHKLLHSDRTHPGHMIDYVLVSKRFRTSVLDTRVYCYTAHVSDHKLVVFQDQGQTEAGRW